MSTVEGLERKVQSLESQLREANLSLKAAKEEACPIKKGAIVRCNGSEYRVASVDVSNWSPSTPPTYWNRPKLYANKKLKDGEWGERLYQLWREWEVVSVAGAA